ncbi:hypothetical protein AB0M43_22190 [Longispora sp. NPDC051575]|uniref:hypothetical protein n=1 Tax=Longispora sp. NPDC051575 TaxID=3154943 RepID=UPI0034275D11
MSKHFYYIAYNFSNHVGSGFGSAEVCLPEEITSTKQVLALANNLKKSDHTMQLVVLSWQLLRVES